MDNNLTKAIIIIVIAALIIFLVTGRSVQKNDIRELMEDELVDEFLTVSLYLEGQENNREEALDAFNTIEQELSKLY